MIKKKTKVATKDDIADFHETYQKLIIDQLEMEQKVWRLKRKFHKNQRKNTTFCWVECSLQVVGVIIFNSFSQMLNLPQLKNNNKKFTSWISTGISPKVIKPFNSSLASIISSLQKW